VHNKVWSSLLEYNEADDTRLHEILNKISGITPLELGLRPELCVEAGIPEAVEHLREMVAKRSPRDKLRCIQRATTGVTSKLEAHLAEQGLTDSKYALTTDDVLPLLMLATIRANVEHTVTCSRYLSHFHASSMSTTELGFHLANYQAGVEFLLRDTLETAVKPPPPQGPETPPQSDADSGGSVALSLVDVDRLDTITRPRTGSVAWGEGEHSSVVGLTPDLDEEEDPLGALPMRATRPEVPQPEDGNVVHALQPEPMARPRRPVFKADKDITLPAATTPFTPIGLAPPALIQTLSPAPSTRQTSDDSLGDFLEALRHEGSSSLSSHQWAPPFSR